MNRRPRPNTHPLRELSRFVRYVWREVLFNAGVLVTRTGSELVGVFLLSPLITRLVAIRVNPALAQDGFLSWVFGAETSSIEVRTIVGWMLTSQAVLVFTVFLRPIAEARLATGLIRSLRSALYDHLQHLAFSFYDKMPSNRLTGRLLKDLDTVSGFLKQGLISSVEISVSMIAYFTLLFTRSAYLCLAVAAMLPIWYLLLTMFNRRAAAYYQRQDASYEEMITAFNENVNGKHVVKAFHTEAREVKRFTALTSVLKERAVETAGFHAGFSPLFGGVAMLSHLGLFAVCAWLIRTGRLPVGDLVILGAAMSTILSRLEQVSQLFSTYPASVAASRRLFDILHVETVDAGSEPVTGRGDVIFENVTFAYGESPPIFRDLTCRFPEGRVTALIGPTSSGKTTLTLLLARFYEPATGRILIGEQPLAAIAIKNLRQHVGFVFQETFLFTGSIRNNIRFGRTDVSEEMMITAAKVAHAHEFIVDLPQGYDTPLGDKGVQLSGGQRQRLALARALVYDPPILILDDATAALDASTDAIVRTNLREVFAGRTVVMITHKTASLRLADHVLVLKAGQVSEAATRDLTALAEEWT